MASGDVRLKSATVGKTDVDFRVIPGELSPTELSATGHRRLAQLHF